MFIIDQQADTAVFIYHFCLPVCLSASVVLLYCMWMNAYIVSPFPPSCRGIILVFFISIAVVNSNVNPFTGAVKYGECGKFVIFNQKCHTIYLGKWYEIVPYGSLVVGCKYPGDSCHCQFRWPWVTLKGRMWRAFFPADFCYIFVHTLDWTVWPRTTKFGMATDGEHMFLGGHPPHLC